MAGFVLALYGFLSPYPLTLIMVLLASTPWIALAVSRASGGKISAVDEPKGHYGLSGFLLFPPLVMMLNDLRFFPLISGWRLIAFGAAFGIALGVIFMALKPPTPRGPKTSKWLIASGWIAAIAYGGSVLTAANGLLPQEPPAKYEVRVLGKHVSSGKSHSYYLRLPPFGPVRDAADWDVGSYMYKRLNVGDRACMYVYPGALHEPWYRVELCADGAPPQQTRT